MPPPRPRAVPDPERTVPNRPPLLAVFRLVEVAEVSAAVDGVDTELRIEVFADAANPGQYRCRTWRLAEYGLHSEEAVDEDGSLATDWQPVWVPWWVPGGFVTDEPFFASSGEAALEAVLDDLRVYLAVTRHAEDGGEPGAGGPPAASA